MKLYSRGFTLIEIICVLTVLTIVFSVAMPSFIGYNNRYETGICKNISQDIIDDIRVACVENRLDYSDDHSELTMKIAAVINDYADGDFSLSSRDNENYVINAASICPRDDKITLEWSVKDSSSSKPDFSDVTVCVSCPEHGEISSTFRVIYK